MKTNESSVAIILGSKSDQDHANHTTRLLDQFGIKWDMQFLSAHRQPDKLHVYVGEAEAKGVTLFIAFAGLSAALPGVIGSMTQLPVIGVPVPAGVLKGIDAMLAMVQMPGGIPVATVGIGSNGSKNAAVLAAQIVALQDDEVAVKVRDYREQMRQG